MMSKVNFSSCAAMALLTISLTLTGCDSSGRTPLRGAVSFDGTPVEKGYIRFSPIEGTKGPTSGADIVDGAYQIPSKRGLMDGNYRVVIEAWKRSDKAYVDPVTGEKSPGGLQQILPARFNTKSELKKEVKAGTGSYDFDLKSE